MAYLHRREVPWTRLPPAVAADIDPYWIDRGLKSVVIGTTGGLLDVGPSRYKINVGLGSLPAMAAGQIGMGAVFTGSNSTYLNYSTGASCSRIAVIKASSVTGPAGISGSWAATGSCELRVYGGALNLLQSGVAQVASGGTVAVGQHTVVGCVYVPGRQEIWQDGRLVGSGTSALSGTVNNQLAIGNGVAGSEAFTGSIYLHLDFLGALSPAETELLTSSPLQVFASISRRYFVGASGGGVTITPGTGALALSTYAPAISQPQTLTPAATALTLTTYVPSVSQAVAITPTTVALNLSTYAPTIAQPQTVTPGVAALTLGTYAPTVSQGVSLTPGVAALTLATYASAVSQPVTLTPPVAALTLSTYAPTVTQNQILIPPTLALTLATYAPTVSQPVPLVPSTAALVLATYAPTVSQPGPIVPGVAALLLATYAPTVTQALPGAGGVRATFTTAMAKASMVTGGYSASFKTVGGG